MRPGTVRYLNQMLTGTLDAYGDAHRATLEDDGVPEPILAALDDAMGSFTRLAKTVRAYIEPDGSLVEQVEVDE